MPLSENPVFRRMVVRLHSMGARPLAELFDELSDRHGQEFAADLIERIEAYIRLDPDFVLALGGDRFPPPPIHSVGEAA